MKPQALRLLSWGAVLLLVAHGAAAQHCTPDDTPLTCWRVFNGVKGETAAKVATTNTGTPTASTAAAATALRDFLSIFAAGVDIGSVSQSGNAVTLDWNVPFPFVEDNDRVKFQSVFSDSDLSKDVQTSLGANAAAAKSKLTNFDDVTTLVSYSPVNRHMGRSIAPHGKFLDDLEATIPVDPAVPLQKVAQFLSEDHPGVPKDMDVTKQFSEITDPLSQATLIQLMESAAEAEQQASASSSTIVKALTQLINNQPQAYLSGIYHYRNALVGPDELSVKGTYEMSPRSLNRFLRANDDVCGDAKVADRGANAKACVDRLAATIPAAPSSQPDANDRLSFALEYKQARSESVDLSGFMIAAPIKRAGVHSLVYSLTYGHPVATVPLKDARIDVAVNYDNISNDPMKKDRFVASVTFSQKISPTMTLPLVLSYANHSDYLPQSDRRVAVHFGLSYKVPDRSGK